MSFERTKKVSSQITPKIHQALEKRLFDSQNCFLSYKEALDWLNTTYGFSFPEEEFYETLGGLIVHLTEEIPQQDDVFSLDQYEFKILEVSSTKIERIHLRVKES